VLERWNNRTSRGTGRVNSRVKLRAGISPLCLFGPRDPRHPHTAVMTIAKTDVTPQLVMSRYHDIVPQVPRTNRQTTVRLPDDLAEAAEVIARIRGASLNQLIIESLEAEIERVRKDEDFVARAKRILKRDREIINRLAQ
jgi:predicted DNA-binding protein